MSIYHSFQYYINVNLYSILTQKENIMWNLFGFFIIVIDLVLISWIIVEKVRKNKLSETLLFIGFVFALNLITHVIAIAYNYFNISGEYNAIFECFDAIGSSVKMFVGEVNVDNFSEIVSSYPIFYVVYCLGIFLALSSTLLTVYEALAHTVKNSFRLSKAMKAETCDIVVGNSATALKYVRTSGAVIQLDASASKETVNNLIEDGYAVLHKAFTPKLLNSRIFRNTTRYNIICTNEENTLEYINTVINFIKSTSKKLDIHLFVEIEGDKAETVRRKLIGKNNMSSYIDTFSINELLARTFTEENPISKYLPEEFFENSALKSNADIAVFILGYGKFGKELYKYSILNNQYVTYTDAYKVLPLHYYLCDTNIDTSEWLITGMKNAFAELSNTAEKYFPLPELTHKTDVLPVTPSSRDILTTIKNQVEKPNSYAFVIIDTEDDYSNIEISAKLETILFGNDNYHIFVLSKDVSMENGSKLTYFGTTDSVLTHDIIVNDSFSKFGKKLNELYEAHYADSEEKTRDDFSKYIQQKANKSWIGLDYFTKYSNIHSAMSLRVKLNLLGLDYCVKNEDSSTNLVLPSFKEVQNYDDNFDFSVRNSLIAQEHARWNAYHLVNEWLPLEKDGITAKSTNNGSVKFNTKIPAAKKHACLTTHLGLNDLSKFLANKANDGSSPATYDFYSYDEFLISIAEEMLNSLGYSVKEKN